VEPDLLPSSGTEAWLEDLGIELQAPDFMNKFWRHSRRVTDRFREQIYIRWEAVHKQAAKEKSWFLILGEEDQHLVH